jgi:thioredoxin-like negative regulator of GroEL
MHIHERKIKSVPSVILVHGGNAVDGFTGLPEQARIDQFFGTLGKLSEPIDDAKEIENKFLELYQRLSEGDAVFIKAQV